MVVFYHIRGYLAIPIKRSASLLDLALVLSLVLDSVEGLLKVSIQREQIAMC